MSSARRRPTFLLWPQSSHCLKPSFLQAFDAVSPVYKRNHVDRAAAARRRDCETWCTEAAYGNSVSFTGFNSFPELLPENDYTPPRVDGTPRPQNTLPAERRGGRGEGARGGGGKAGAPRVCDDERAAGAGARWASGLKACA
ncbi:hypothetical protein B0H14DRAFT_3128496 [Mycena olivaceomarginata]|nr:hypothetical protein B0H14DRAFT_3128496 [Mycena olivaceomarginata]